MAELGSVVADASLPLILPINARMPKRTILIPLAATEHSSLPLHSVLTFLRSNCCADYASPLDSSRLRPLIPTLTFSFYHLTSLGCSIVPHDSTSITLSCPGLRLRLRL